MRLQGLDSDSPKDELRFNPEPRQSPFEADESKARARFDWPLFGVLIASALISLGTLYVLGRLLLAVL